MNWCWQYLKPPANILHFSLPKYLAHWWWFTYRRANRWLVKPWQGIHSCNPSIFNKYFCGDILYIYVQQRGSPKKAFVNQSNKIASRYFKLVEILHWNKTGHYSINCFYFQHIDIIINLNMNIHNQSNIRISTSHEWQQSIREQMYLCPYLHYWLDLATAKYVLYFRDHSNSLLCCLIS